MTTEFSGFVDCSGRKLWVEFAPAPSGAPVLLQLNGLSSTTQNWRQFNHLMEKKGYGFLRFDFRGQGQSLQEELRQHGSFATQVPVANQADDTLHLLNHFQIKPPYFVMAESYGGAVALELLARAPADFAKALLLAPYLIRLDLAHPVQRLWAWQFDLLSRTGSLQQQFANQVRGRYKRLLARYMDHRFASQIQDPQAREASILLTLGSFEFDAFSCLHRFPPGVLNLVTAGEDSLVPRSLFREFWWRLAPEVRQSWLIVEDAHHQILEEHPGLVADWAAKVFQGDTPAPLQPNVFSVRSTQPEATPRPVRFGWVL